MTSINEPIDITARFEPDENYDPLEVAQVLGNSFRLMLGELDTVDWLQSLAEMTSADSAFFLRWVKDEPHKRAISTFGEVNSAFTGFESAVEKTFAKKNVTIPALLDKYLLGGDNAVKSGNCPFAGIVAGLIAAEPSRIIVGICRSKHSKPWTPKDRHRFACLLPQFASSIKLHKHVVNLDNYLSIANAIFNASPRGMILLEPSGKVTVANEFGRKLLDDNDGMWVNDAMLVTESSEINSKIKEILERMDQFTDKQVRELRWFWSLNSNRRDHTYQLAFEIIRLPDWKLESRTSGNVGLLLVNDPKSLLKPDESQLMDFYGLTEAQARVAVALWGGLGVAEAADKLCISVNTARSHLRAIYEKTGTRSHGEFMSLLAATLIRLDKDERMHKTR